MDTRWAAEETRLWQEMHAQPRTTASKKNARLVAQAKLKAKREHSEVPPHIKAILEPEEAIARSWQAYRRWLAH